MKFEEALPALRKGKSITRTKYYGWFKKLRRKLIYTCLNSDGTFSRVEVSFGSDDVFADDWRIL